jgi:hypothetical protein
MVNYKLIDLGRDLVREGFRERHQRLWARILYRMAQQVPFRARGRMRSPLRIMRGERERHDLAFVGTTRPSMYSNFGSGVEPPTMTAILPVYLPTESTVVVRWMWDKMEDAVWWRRSRAFSDAYPPGPQGKPKAIKKSASISQL